MIQTRLSPREKQIAALLSQGHSSTDIAKMLFLSPKTVASHKERIKNKLGIDNRVAWMSFLKGFVPQ